MVFHLLSFPAALLLDLLIGDPPHLPHPIRWMGSAITAMEPRFRSLSLPLRWVGVLFALALVLGTFVVCLASVGLMYHLHPVAGFVVETLVLFYCLSIKSLAEAAETVQDALKEEGLENARKSLSMIVGRETGQLDAVAVNRAVIETVSENLVDGVLAPLFYAALGGAPLALTYKMINTLDSMVGYKNERYREFGWASARLDDAAGYLPARLSVPIIGAASQMLLRKGKGAFLTALKDGGRHKSPNAGLPEAAFAGALGVRLGGPNVYHGQTVEKPWIGTTFPDPSAGHVWQAVNLMLLSAGFGFLFFFAIRILIFSL